MKTKQQIFEEKVRRIVKEEIDDLKLQAAARKLNDFFRVNNTIKIYNLLKQTKFDEQGVPLTNVSELSKLLNSTSDAGTKQYVKIAVTR